MKFPLFAAGLASASLLPRDQCCFQLTASGGVSGVVGQLSDGQNRVGGSYPTGSYCISNGGITDGQGRGCILTPPSSQFQCDVGASPTYGFSINPSGQVLSNGNGVFYACPATETEYNIYTVPVPDQKKCVQITLSTGGKCGAPSSPSPPPSSPGPPPPPAPPVSSSSAPPPAPPVSSSYAPPISSSYAPPPAPPLSSSYAPPPPPSVSTSAAPPPPPPSPPAPPVYPTSATYAPPPPVVTSSSSKPCSTSAPAPPPPPPVPTPYNKPSSSHRPPPTTAPCSKSSTPAYPLPTTLATTYACNPAHQYPEGRVCTEVNGQLTLLPPTASAYNAI